MSPTIIIDPGHGGHDPGVVCDGMTEKRANLVTALTINYLLGLAGYKTRMTRTGDNYPPLQERSRVWPGEQLLISVHYNSVGTYGLVYHKGGCDKSLTLAQALACEAGLSRVWPTSMSRFGRLYIDDCSVPAVLYEVGAIDEYPWQAKDPEAARDYRIQRAVPVVRAVQAHVPLEDLSLGSATKEVRS